MGFPLAYAYTLSFVSLCKAEPLSNVVQSHYETECSNAYSHYRQRRHDTVRYITDKFTYSKKWIDHRKSYQHSSHDRLRQRERFAQKAKRPLTGHLPFDNTTCINSKEQTHWKHYDYNERRDSASESWIDVPKTDQRQ